MATLLTKVGQFEQPWSLRQRLLRILLITLSAVSLVYAALVFFAILQLGQRNSDRALLRSAQLLLEFIEADGRHGLAGLGVLDDEDQSELPSSRIWLWDGQGRPLIVAAHAPVPVHGSTAPTYQILADGTSRWQVVTVWNGAHTLQMQVAGPAREAMAGASSLATLMVVALLLSLPGAGLLVWGAVARAVSPVPLAAAQVALRGPDDLSEIPAQALPLELAPLVTAFNQLLGRVAAALAQERLFAANAAHELRTPLAAIRIHAQLAQRGPQSVAEPALQKLITNVDRMTRMVEQLLNLARLESGALSLQAAEPFRIDRLLEETCLELEAQCRSRGVQLGFAVEGDCEVRAPFQASYMLVRNLVENAVRYSPENLGQVQVTAGVDVGGWWLKVLDNGVGLSPAQRDLLLGHRAVQQRVDASGTGLGLAIVRRVVDLLDAQIQLSVGLHEQGTGIVVEVPNRRGSRRITGGVESRNSNHEKPEQSSVIS